MDRPDPIEEVSVRIGINRIYDQVTTMSRKLTTVEMTVNALNGHEERLRKLENSIAAVFVIHSITIAVIIAIVVGAFK